MMKTQIKLTAIVLAFVMLFGMCFSVSAEAPIKLEIKLDSDVHPGDNTVTAFVHITGANIKSIGIAPTCDADFVEIAEAKWSGVILEDAELKPNWNGTDIAAIALETARDFNDEAVFKIIFNVDEVADIGSEFVLELTDVAVAVMEDGVEVVYKADENAGVITLVPFTGELVCNHNYVTEKNEDEHWSKCSKCDDVKDREAHVWDDGVQNGSMITYTCTCGQTKTESAVVYGDVNGDGAVNAKDRTYLARYLTEWTGYDETTIVLANADVNADGVVNAKDRTVLARYLTEWTGYETLPYGK